MRGRERRPQTDFQVADRPQPAPPPAPAGGLSNALLARLLRDGAPAQVALAGRLLQRAPPVAASEVKPAEKAAEAKKDEPSEDDKAEFELMKGAISDADVAAYLKRRRDTFGSDAGYKTAAEEADKEFDGIKNLVGQAEDSIASRKVLYRWLRKAYKGAGIDDPVATIKGSMTPELKEKIATVKKKHPDLVAGGFAARPQKLSEKYILGTLSEHGKGNAVDIFPERNPQLTNGEWSFIKTYAAQDKVDVSAATWKDKPKDVWKAVNDLNTAFVAALKKKIEEKTKPAESPKEAAKTDGGTVAKADAKATSPPSKEEVIKAELKGQSNLLKCVLANGESHGFFDLSEALVVDLHGQGLTWGATFPSNVDLHHFQL